MEPKWQTEVQVASTVPTQTHRWAKQGESETRIQIATTTPTACFISLTTTTWSTMIPIRRRKMFSGKSFSRNVQKKRKRDCTMAARSTLTDHFQVVKELQDNWAHVHRSKRSSTTTGVQSSKWPKQAPVDHWKNSLWIPLCSNALRPKSEAATF